MDRQEYEWLRSGLGQLDEFLAMTPESAVISRMSLESEREEIAAKLAAFTPPARWPATARLTFDGDPVEGRRGIDAAFAYQALEKYEGAVASAGASLVGPLKDKGPIPNRENYRLLITNVATGSFGFEIEEANPTDGPDPSPAEQGIMQVHTLLKTSALTDDDAIAAAHPRVLSNVHGFLKIVADNQAICSVAFDGDRFRFDDTAQVRKSLDILNPANIREYDDEFSGHFVGYLPGSRLAEFVNHRTGEFLSGRVVRSVRSADQINDVREVPFILRVRIRKAGTRKPSYTITGYDLPENDDRIISMSMPLRITTGNRRALSQGNVDQPPDSSD